jgi:excisionase family DNA binding protein
MTTIPTDDATVVTGQRLLTADELADHLHVSRAQVYNFLRLGLPSLKLGKSRRFRLADVTVWLDQFSEGGQP